MGSFELPKGARVSRSFDRQAAMHLGDFFMPDPREDQDENTQA